MDVPTWEGGVLLCLFVSSLTVFGLLEHPHRTCFSPAGRSFSRPSACESSFRTFIFYLQQPPQNSPQNEQIRFFFCTKDQRPAFKVCLVQRTTSELVCALSFTVTRTFHPIPTHTLKTAKHARSRRPSERWRQRSTQQRRSRQTRHVFFPSFSHPYQPVSSQVLL